jgi:hypothetical protein
VSLYDLPLWALDAGQFPDNGIHGQGWRVGAKIISVPPAADEAFYAHISSMRERYPHYAVNCVNGRIAPQIYVEAKSRIAAQKAFDLIRASLMLIDGSPLFFVQHILWIYTQAIVLRSFTLRTIHITTCRCQAR